MHEVALAQARISWSRIKHNFKEDDFLKNSKIYIVIYIEYLHNFLNLIYFVSLEFNKFFKCNKILIILKSIFVNIYFFLDIFFFFLLKEDSNSHHNYVIHLLQYCYLSLFVYETKEKGFPTQPARLTGSVLSHVLRDTNAHQSKRRWPFNVTDRIYPLDI